MTEGVPARPGGSSPAAREKTTVLIVCEGKETERNYFDQLKRDEPTRQNFSITVKRGKGGSRQQIAQFAVDRKNDVDADYDQVWCVMDVESPEGTGCDAGGVGIAQGQLDLRRPIQPGV